MYHSDFSEILEALQLNEKADVKAMMAEMSPDQTDTFVDMWYTAYASNIKLEDGSEQFYREQMKNRVADVLGSVNSAVTKAESMFVREDRVVWTTKYLKLAALVDIFGWSLKGPSGGVTGRLDFQRLNEVLNKFKFVKKMRQAMDTGAFSQDINSMLNVTDGGQDCIDHALRVFNMFRERFDLNIPALNAMVWESSWNLGALNQAMMKIINEYNAEWEGWIPVDEDEEKIVKYYKSESMAWFDLMRASCSEEGKAMGHCGNSPRSGSDDNIYSLATIKKRKTDGKWFRKPHVTAVLEDNGLLGEMKGRGNDKPHKKYGEMMVDLCLLPPVRGIGEPRWETENNWRWDDFTDEQQQRILKEKPNFEEGGSASVFKQWQSGDADNSDLYNTLRGYHYGYVSLESVSNYEITVSTSYQYGEVIQDLYDYLSETISSEIEDVVDDLTYLSEDEEVEDDDSVSNADLRGAANDLVVETILYGIMKGHSINNVRDAIYASDEFKTLQKAGRTGIPAILKIALSDDRTAAALKARYPEITNQLYFDFVDKEHIDADLAKNLQDEFIKKGKSLEPIECPLFEIVYDNAIDEFYEGFRIHGGAGSAYVETATPGDLGNEYVLLDFHVDYLDETLDYYDDTTDIDGTIAHIIDVDLADSLRESELEYNTTNYTRQLAEMITDPASIGNYTGELKTKLIRWIYKEVSGKDYPWFA